MNKIVLSDVRFVLGIKKVNGTVTYSKGIPVFTSKELGITEIIDGFADEDKEGHTRNMAFPVWSNNSGICKEIKKGITKYEERMSDEDEDILLHYDEIYEQYEAQKLRLVPRTMTFAALFFIFFLLAIISFMLQLLYEVTIGCLVLSVIGYVFYRINARSMNQKVVYDMDGNWIDFNNCTTSLMNGGKIPGKG